MIDFYYEGGPLFMSLVTLAGLVAFGLLTEVLIKITRGNEPSSKKLKSIPLAGSIAFMMGMLSQVIGLYQAVSAIQAAGDVSPALIAGGFQVSLIAPIYGLILFMLSLIAYLVINLLYSYREEKALS